jgi:hypothetical protein
MLLAESLLGSSSAAANYIEDVFSTYLYTGTGASQTITNGIDLAGKGGLVWIKGRSGATDHVLYDTANVTGGLAFGFASNTTEAATYRLGGLNAFLSSGFSIGNLARINTSAATYASWTFREQPKFFDIVTYTGNGANRTIAHNLGSVPGCIMIKRADTTAAWAVYHRSLANTQYMVLNTTAAAATGATYWNSTTPTSSVFSLGTSTDVNASGGTYVAYLFAHNAGGFGASGTDNVISCGSVTDVSTGTVSVNLGYEPQFILYKKSAAISNWFMQDNMRGMPVYTGSGGAYVSANSNAVEAGAGNLGVTATGFDFGAGGTDTWIYIAIRRGPMKTPTTGTSVFSPIASSAVTGTKQTTDFPVDLQIYSRRSLTLAKGQVFDRLRGVSSTTTESGQQLQTHSTAAEASVTGTLAWDNTGFQTPSTYSATGMIYWNFRRAPGFFDVVCYTGDAVAGRTVSHNLTVAPELMFVKSRSDGTSQYNWATYVQSLGNTKYLYLNTIDSEGVFTQWNNTSPTATNFTLGSYIQVNASGSNFVAYLFASCPGVSKVGSYTGTGTTKQIDCGFTGGARFVLIKRTDSTGDWYVWDTARGIVAGNDSYLLLNSTAAEVTNTDYVDTYSAGFEISSTAPAAINANGGSFIFFAVA